MKVRLAIPSSGKDLSAVVDPRFGRCDYFTIVDSETLYLETIENPFTTSNDGAGIKSAKLLADQGVDVVLAGNIGPNALEILKAAGIAVITGANGEISRAVEDYRSGKLEASPTIPQSHRNSRFSLNTGRRGLGPGGECVCTNCGATIPHRQGFPCREETCPSCGGKMGRK